MSIKGKDMKIFLLFDLKKVLLLSYVPSKLSWKVEILYVHLVEVLNLPFEGLDIQSYFNPSQPQRTGFLHFYHFLSLFLA